MLPYKLTIYLKPGQLDFLIGAYQYKTTDFVLTVISEDKKTQYVFPLSGISYYRVDFMTPEEIKEMELDLEIEPQMDIDDVDPR